MNEPKLYSIGVLLTDKSNPPKLYELDTIWADGGCTLVLVGNHARMYTRNAHISEFWPLLDSMPT
jgi:hypothetical protein